MTFVTGERSESVGKNIKFLRPSRNQDCDSIDGEGGGVSRKCVVTSFILGIFGFFGFSGVSERRCNSITNAVPSRLHHLRKK